MCIFCWGCEPDSQSAYLCRMCNKVLVAAMYVSFSRKDQRLAKPLAKQ